MARFSVVVPAHNERADLGRSLRAIARAAQAIRTEIEVVVVVLDSDAPHARLAADTGAAVVEIGRPNITAVRNVGAMLTTGQILVTIDADRLMSSATFAEIERLLATGCYVGGGAILNPERHSLAIDVAMVLTRLTTYLIRASAAGCTGAVATTSTRSRASTNESPPSTTSTSRVVFERTVAAPDASS